MKKTALLTGASSGIGLELAKIHAQHGGDLVIVARREEKLQSLKSELEKIYGVKVYVIAKDLTAENAVKSIYEDLKKANIKIDYLINNAGFGGIGKFHERKWHKDKAMIDLNIRVLTELCQYYIPDMIAQKGGKILNVSSTASFLPGPNQAVYYATKAYVQSFSNAISEELYDTDVTVTNLMPGATKTEFGKKSGMDKTSLFKKPASAHQVAKAGYMGMLKGKRDIIAGVPIGGKILLRMIPFIPKGFLLSEIRKAQTTD